jgi:uncharacterized protein
MMKQTSTERLNIVDALRGFALMGIALVHFMEQYYGWSPPSEHSNYTQHIPSDGVFEMIVNILLRGKFFMLFSFLFGLSFFLQMDHAAEKGANFSGRFLWRLVILFAIGFVHHLFYRGDILTVFALLGIPLIAFYKVPDKWILAVSLLLMLGLPRLIIVKTQPQVSYEEQIKKSEPLEKVYWQAAKYGSLKDLAYQNLTLGTSVKTEAQFGSGGRGYQTFALFLMGLYAGRKRLFENIEEKLSLIKKGFWYSLIAFLSVFAIGALLFLALKLPQKFGETGEMLTGLMLYDMSNLFNASLYVFGFLWLFIRKTWWQRQILKLAPYGRMALTNYVLQTLIGTTIFFGFGLGKLGDFGSTVTFFMGLGIFILQRLFSQWWLQRYHFGFLEWVWRSLTFLTWQRFKK